MLSHYHIPPRGCSAPSESEPIPPEASPLLGHGPVKCPFQTFVRRLVGHRRPHLQGFTAWMSPPCRPESFLLNSNLLGLLDQNCSSPSFAWSVHNYMDARCYFGMTPRPRMTLKAHPVLGVFYWLPWAEYCIPGRAMSCMLSCFLRRNLRCGGRQLII